MNKTYLSRLSNFHLGPGEHPSGSSQDVHAGDEAGAANGPGSQKKDAAKRLFAVGDKFGENKKKNIEIAMQAWADEGVQARVLSRDDPKHIRDGIKKKGAAYYYNYLGKEEIVINPHNDYWKNPRAYTETEGGHEKGFYSTLEPGRVLVHEYAHYKFSEPVHAESAFINDRNFKEIVSEQVGRYAATNSREFIAEVYTGLESGKQYSPLIMDRYNRYKIDRHP